VNDRWINHTTTTHGPSQRQLAGIDVELMKRWIDG